MIDIPVWIQYFVLIGIGSLLVVIPLRVVWEATRGSRKAGKKAREFAERLRGKFGGVAFRRGVFTSDCIDFTHGEKEFTLCLASPRKLILSLNCEVRPKFRLYMCTRTAFSGGWKIFWESVRILPRVRLSDKLVDDRVAIYAPVPFGAYLRDLALDAIPAQGKPEGVAESLVVLSRIPGVRKFRFTMSPAGGIRLWMKLRTEDMFYRPEELETAAHHMLRLYEAFVTF
ncbi:MAG: hypothetical protein ACYTAF_11585 [Planctomycetota bacterium]|jgi:hypothetical protein